MVKKILIRIINLASLVGIFILLITLLLDLFNAINTPEKYNFGNNEFNGIGNFQYESLMNYLIIGCIMIAFILTQIYLFIKKKYHLYWLLYILLASYTVFNFYTSLE